MCVRLLLSNSPLSLPPPSFIPFLSFTLLPILPPFSIFCPLSGVLYPITGLTYVHIHICTIFIQFTHFVCQSIVVVVLYVQVSQSSFQFARCNYKLSSSIPTSSTCPQVNLTVSTEDRRGNLLVFKTSLFEMKPNLILVEFRRSKVSG